MNKIKTTNKSLFSMLSRRVEFAGKAQMCWFSCVLLVMLGGCASGTVLNKAPEQPQDAALLLAPSGVLLGIGSLHSQIPWTSLNSAKDSAVWLTPGWFLVSYSCAFLYEEGEVTAIMVNEDATERGIKVEAGRYYQLECDSKRLGVVHLHEISAPTNISSN